MGFFQTFWSWLNATLAGYIGNNTARVAAALEPAIVTLATIYLMGWGYLQLTGRSEEDVGAGIRRIVVLALVLAVALHLWLYNALIVDTFYAAPAQLAGAVIGSADPVGTIDAIWQQGGAVAEQLWDKGAVYNSDIGYYLAGGIVWILIGTLCVYAMFLISLSSIACAVLLAIGPLFIAMLLFESTRRYFEAWIAQLSTYALISILTVLVAALLLQIVESYAAQTAARGTAILTVDALDMVLVSALVFLLMRQIMPIAAGLGGGLALSSFGIASRMVAWGTGRGRILVAPAAAKAWKMVASKVGAISPRRSTNSEAGAPSWREP
ncbi:MAG: type IV secretion system protein [Steroidobacteraceae bacterium]|jgi:type IV secretion system protein VirB6